MMMIDRYYCCYYFSIIINIFMLLFSVMDRDQFVDCMALASLWPREFDEFQILVVNLDREGSFNVHQGFTHIRAPQSRYVDKNGYWKGKDIVLTLQCGHFTHLVPIGENIRDRPVSKLIYILTYTYLI